MPFSIVTGEGFSHWADVELARAWFAEADRLTSDAAVTALDQSGDWTRQKAMMMAAYAAVSNAYRAMNLSPVTDPEFRAAWHEQFGSTERGQRVAFPMAQLNEDVVPSVAGLVASSALDQLAARFRGETALVRFRLWINPTTGAVGSSCPERPGPGQQGCNFPDVWCPGEQAMPPRRYTWLCMAADRPLVGEHWVLPPLRFFLPFVQRLARAGVRRGPMGVLAEARAFVPRRNGEIASRMNIPVAEGIEEADRMSTELLRASQGGAMSGADPTTRGVWAGMRLASQLNPISSAVASAIDAFMGIFTRAVGYYTDEFGRLRASNHENFEVPYIALGRGPTDPPPINIPPAPMRGIQMAIYGLPNMEELLRQTQGVAEDPATHIGRNRVEGESGPWLTEGRKKLFGVGLLGFAGFLVYDRFRR